MPSTSQQLQYTTINDFRPGIVDNVRRGGAGSTPPGFSIELPPGMASENNTFDCIANMTGQLVPLPKGSLYRTITPSSPVLAHQLVCGGIRCVGPIKHVAQTHLDDIHVFLQYIILGAAEEFEWWLSKGGIAFIRLLQRSSGGGGTFITRGMTSVVTRGRRTAFFSLPGYPLIAIEATIGPGADPYTDGATQEYWVYPDPSDLTSDVPFGSSSAVVNSTGIYGGQLIAHSGRILRLCENNTDHGVGTKFQTNELVRFGDPPGNVDLTGNTGANTDTVLDPQYPGGYGAWGSISFGELLLIKRYGGALLVEGDIYAPQITRLAGIVSIGNLMNVASFSPIGMIYCVENDGAYVWHGGDIARKISKISDTFYKGIVTFSSGLQAGHTPWQNWVIFTNGWLYDPLNDSWWRLSNPLADDTQPIQWWCGGMGSPQFLYGVPGSPGSVADDKIRIVRYDRTIPVSRYQWQSQPIPLLPGKSVDIREIEVSVCDIPATGVSSVEITIGDQADPTSFDSSPITLTPGAGPFRVRVTGGGKVNGSFVLNIVMNNTDNQPAPTLNSITVGWEEAGSLPAS